MEKEDKNLLLQDLSARLPYGIICSTSKGNGHLCSINQTIFGNEYGVNVKSTERDYFNDSNCDIKPYLRPMSSMTEEEKAEFELLGWRVDELDNNHPWAHGSVDDTKGVDFLNSHHFDYRGLIGKGLAIAVTEENNPYA